MKLDQMIFQPEQFCDSKIVHRALNKVLGIGGREHMLLIPTQFLPCNPLTIKMSVLFRNSKLNDKVDVF